MNLTVKMGYFIKTGRFIAAAVVIIKVGCLKLPTVKQCHSKGNISGGGVGTRALEARAARGFWQHAPPENFEI